VSERFTERGRQVLEASRLEARDVGHSRVGSEHLLLGLLRDDESLATSVLESFGLPLAEVEPEVIDRGGSDEMPLSPWQIPFTPEAEQVVERARASKLGHRYAGAEHILLALVATHESTAATLLTSLGVDIKAVHEATVGLLRGEANPEPPPSRVPRDRPRTVRRPVLDPEMTGDVRVSSHPTVARLLMKAAAEALDDGRVQMTTADLLLAMAHDAQCGAVFAELGVDETTIRAALQSLQPPREPSDGDAGAG
jgi:ATP-dependent Clp protease ATP-binding subunit ClpA